MFDIKIQGTLRLTFMLVLEYLFTICSKHGGFRPVALVALARSRLALSSRSVNPEMSDFIVRHNIGQTSDVFQPHHRAVLDSIRLVYLTLPGTFFFLLNTELGSG